MGRRAALACGVVVLLLAPPVRSADVPIAVIVHPSRHVTLGLDDVTRIFLKKQRFWDDGEPIIPLNREVGSTLRESFSRRVFGFSTAGLAGYWNEQYFLGTLPPATLASSEAVKRYVASEPNAIGYVEANAADRSVRIVLQIGGEGAEP
jgi:ABC-type phosphate transport system substrate-binding protein